MSWNKKRIMFHFYHSVLNVQTGLDNDDANIFICMEQGKSARGNMTWDPRMGFFTQKKKPRFGNDFSYAAVRRQ